MPGLVFSASLSRQGYWTQQVNALRGDPDSMLKILASDASSLTQLRTRAKELKIVLLFARSGEHVYVRAYLPSEEQTRLVLWLREPRTLNELRSKGFEFNLEAELQTLASHGHAEFTRDKWKLTEKGKKELVERQQTATAAI